MFVGKRMYKQNRQTINIFDRTFSQNLVGHILTKLTRYSNIRCGGKTGVSN